MNLRRFARAEDFIVFQVGIQHVAGLAIHNSLFEQRVGDSLLDTAVDLADDAGRVDRTAAVVSPENLLKRKMRNRPSRTFQEKETT